MLLTGSFVKQKFNFSEAELICLIWITPLVSSLGTRCLAVGPEDFILKML